MSISTWIGSVSSGPVALALNPLDAAANVVLTNSDKTATRNSPSAWRGVRSVTSHAAGKYYYEVVPNGFASNNLGVGFANSAALLTDYFGVTTNGICILTDGNVYKQPGAATNTLPAIAAGSVVQIAIDLTADLIWFKDDGGLWNNSGTANPATGAGGITLPVGLTGATEVFAGGHAFETNNTFTVNFGTDPFVYVPPSGFAAWG